jgi:hypothetical protein
MKKYNAKGVILENFNDRSNTINVTIEPINTMPGIMPPQTHELLLDAYLPNINNPIRTTHRSP